MQNIFFPGTMYRSLCPLFDHTGKCIVKDQFLKFIEEKDGFPWGIAFIFQAYSKVRDSNSYLGEVYLSQQQAAYLEASKM